MPVKAFRNLAGEDDELVTAYARFHKMVERERVIVEYGILSGVEKLSKDNKALHTNIKVICLRQRVQIETPIL